MILTWISPAENVLNLNGHIPGKRLFPSSFPATKDQLPGKGWLCRGRIHHLYPRLSISFAHSFAMTTSRSGPMHANLDRCTPPLCGYEALSRLGPSTKIQSLTSWLQFIPNLQDGQWTRFISSSWSKSPINLDSSPIFQTILSINVLPSYSQKIVIYVNSIYMLTIWIQFIQTGVYIYHISMIELRGSTAPPMVSPPAPRHTLQRKRGILHFPTNTS